jgi:hypothetical protein
MVKLSSFNIKDEKIYNRFKSLCTELNVGIHDSIWQYIEKQVAAFDGKRSGKMDLFFDPNYVPKPEIDDDMETRIIPWLRSLNTEQLSKRIQFFYQAYVWSKALHSTPPSDRHIVNFDLTTLWKQYR